MHDANSSVREPNMLLGLTNQLVRIWNKTISFRHARACRPKVRNSWVLGCAENLFAAFQTRIGPPL